MKKRQLMARNINAEFDKKMTFGQRAADKVAELMEELIRGTAKG